MLRNIHTLSRLIGSRSQSCSRRQFYDWRTRSDTIYALSTTVDPKRGSPLAVIRVSGPATANILQNVTQLEPLRQNKLVKTASLVLKPRYATLSKIFASKGAELIDMGLILWFPQPHSYTGEDVCEFHVHGSRAIIKRLMTILGSFDATRPAEPGEFTRRAIVNKKLDLVQAESLSDLISAQTDRQRKLALQGLIGSTRSRYEAWIETLIRILAHLEASIDFGEDELIGEKEVVGDCVNQLTALALEISDFISVAGRCRDLIESGANAVILGRPNAGKSTLMNILCRQDKSIVSDLSGTTRDVVEHSFELGGHRVTLSDTAGLKNLNCIANRNTHAKADQSSRKSHDDIEQEGIKRALDAARSADLIIYLVDGSQISKETISDLIEELLRVLDILQIENRNSSIHLVINKSDLAKDIDQLIDKKELTQRLKNRLHGKSNIKVAMISCTTHHNIDTLIESMSSSLNDLHLQDNVPGTEMDYVNERHLCLLENTSRHLERAKTLDILRIDEMAQHVRESVDYLSRIVGRVTNEQVLDIIFRDFCIGK